MLQGGSLWSGIISGALCQAQDHNKMRSGILNKSQYAANTTKNMGGSLGIMAGVEYGALLGTTILPGVGTAVGSVAGAIIGGRLGHQIGHGLAQLVGQQALNSAESMFTDSKAT